MYFFPSDHLGVLQNKCEKKTDGFNFESVRVEKQQAILSQTQAQLALCIIHVPNCAIGLVCVYNLFEKKNKLIWYENVINGKKSDPLELSLVNRYQTGIVPNGEQLIRIGLKQSGKIKNIFFGHSLNNNFGIWRRAISSGGLWSWRPSKFLSIKKRGPWYRVWSEKIFTGK